jgi:hypothetical protein
VDELPCNSLPGSKVVGPHPFRDPHDLVSHLDNAFFPSPLLEDPLTALEAFKPSDSIVNLPQLVFFRPKRPKLLLDGF